MTDIKGEYGFSSWPANSIVDAGEMPVNFRLDKEPGFRLLNRLPVFYPMSYEDVYQSSEDEDVRISVKVFNCASFDEAKEKLADHLSQCAFMNIPQITDRMDALSADIAFGAADGSGRAISAVRGNTLFVIKNIGLKSVDLIPFYRMIHEKINRMRQR